MFRAQGFPGIKVPCARTPGHQGSLCKDSRASRLPLQGLPGIKVPCARTPGLQGSLSKDSRASRFRAQGLPGIKKTTTLVLCRHYRPGRFRGIWCAQRILGCIAAPLQEQQCRLSPWFLMAQLQIYAATRRSRLHQCLMGPSGWVV